VRRASWTTWQSAAVALAVTASLLLCVLPLVRRTSSVSTSDGAVVVTEESATLLAEQGPGLLVVLAVPVLLTLVPLLLRRRLVAFACAGLLAAGIVVSGFSIGLYYVPALLTAIGALAVLDAARPPRVLQVEGRWPGY
jgi:hypothetical protein